MHRLYSAATVTGATIHTVAAEYPQGTLKVPSMVLQFAVATAVLPYMRPTWQVRRNLDVIHFHILFV